MLRNVFIRRPEPKPGLPLGAFLGLKSVKGDVGLEIELESYTTPFPIHPDQLPKTWVYHEDHSLKAKFNAEYVLAKPLKFAAATDAVNELWAVLEEKKIEMAESNRTSVHVHLNAQEFYMNRLATFIGLYFCFEEILTAYCGEHRVGNLFCLRAKDATGIVTNAKKFIKSDGVYRFNDSFHYSGLNLHALLAHGSLEVRCMRGPSNPEQVIAWVKILQALYEFSAKFEDPRQAISTLSGSGAEGFFHEVFGDSAGPLAIGSGMTLQQLRESILEGVRYAQDICYCRDWSEFKTVKLEKDPFGRDLNKVAPTMAAPPISSVQPAAAGGYLYQGNNGPIDLADFAFEPEPDYGEEDY